MRLATIAALGLACFLTGLFPSPAHGAKFFGPTPYLSAADSPFDLSGLGTTFFLEDFEDGELNTPGVTSPGSGFSLKRPRPPTFVNQTDSVDADDGVIDGVGAQGHSIGPISGFCTNSVPPLCAANILFNFDASPLGMLPTAAGIVWTDGFTFFNNNHHFIVFTFSAYGPQGELLGTLAGGDLGGNRFEDDIGETAEDRFFGVINPGGISAIFVEAGGVNGSDHFEADHLQYGLFVPEPGSFYLLGLGLAMLLVGWARKSWRGRK